MGSMGLPPTSSFSRSGSNSRRQMDRSVSPLPNRTRVDMDPLVDTLTDDAVDVDKKREAVATIRSSLKNNPENKARLLAAGGIDALIALLPSSDPATVEHAVTSLLNMSLTEGVEPLITSAGGIEAIVPVLGTGSPAARENAAAALFSLSGPMENKVKVRDAGAIPFLISLLQTGSLRGKKDASLALFNLSLESSCVRDIIAAGTVKVLVQLLTDAEPGMEDKVMAVIANLCKSAEGRQSVHTEGGIAAMVDVIDGGSSRAKEDAAVALHLLATNSEASFQLLLEEGAMPALVKLAQSGSGRGKAKAKALLDLLRGYASANSQSFRHSGSFNGSYSQTFDKRPPMQAGEIRDRGLTGELR
ncbi:unnamed protein product [Closterium sp. NIES-53]